MELGMMTVRQLQMLLLVITRHTYASHERCTCGLNCHVCSNAVCASLMMLHCKMKPEVADHYSLDHAIQSTKIEGVVTVLSPKKKTE